MNKTVKILIISLITFLFLGNISTAFQKKNYSNTKIDSTGINSLNKNTVKDSVNNNQIHIDTGRNQVNIDTNQKNNTSIIDSLYKTIKEKDVLTNTKILLYIFLSVIGLFLFFFLFVQTLFKIFHKTRSTRQSLLLSWNLFFVVSILWIYIIWGILASLWNSGAFLTVIIFLMVVSLIMLITAIKSK